MWRFHKDSPSDGLISYMWIQSDSDLTSLINFEGVCVTGLMCSPLACNFCSTPVLVHKGLIHGVMTSLPWQTGLQCQQSCTIALAHSVGYKWRSYQDSPSDGLISYMWIQSDSDLTSLINFEGVCVTGLMCSPLAGNFCSTPVLVHKGLIHGVMTSLPWQTGLQCQQSCTIALAHSVGYKWRSYQDSPSDGLISYMWIQSDSDLTSLINFEGVCVTGLMCSPLAGNFCSTPVLVHKGLIHGVMTSLPWQTGLQCQQSCTIALAHSVGYSFICPEGVNPLVFSQLCIYHHSDVQKTNTLGATSEVMSQNIKASKSPKTDDLSK